jgi:hypothetical protein
MVDLERISGKNADHWGSTLAVVRERIPAIRIESCMQRKRNDAILRADYGRRGDRNLAVSGDGSRHETKTANTTQIPNTHSNYLLLLSSTASGAIVPPHTQPPMAQVPSAIFELLRVAPSMSMNSRMWSFPVVCSEIVRFLAKPLRVSDGAVECTIDATHV